MACLLGAALSWLPAAASASVDPFYDRLFQDATLALSLDQPDDAAKKFRLACFGMLEDPPRLADCLTRLALAQAALEDREAFLATLGRVLDVERRFNAYSEAAVPVAMRRDFESRVEAWAPAATISGVAAFSAIAERQAAAQLAPAAGKASQPAGTAETVDDTTREPTSPSADAPSFEAVTESSAAGATAAATPPGDSDVRQIAEGWTVLRGDARDRFPSTYETVAAVSRRHPEWSEAHHLAAELAYRLSRWTEAVRHFRAAEDIVSTRPEAQFYLAVALFKSGDQSAAEAMLERCLPSIQRSDYVRFWEQRIRAGNPS